MPPTYDPVATTTAINFSVRKGYLSNFELRRLLHDAVYNANVELAEACAFELIARERQQTNSDIEREKLILNERIKASISYLNSVATTMLAVGVVTPVYSSLSSAKSASGVDFSFWISLVCLSISLFLHAGARHTAGTMLK